MHIEALLKYKWAIVGNESRMVTCGVNGMS